MAVFYSPSKNGTISVLGSGRTSVDEDIRNAATAYQFAYLPEPSPEENLFMSSDKFPLAQKGIPAIIFSMGIDKMDEKVNSTYRKVIDEVENMDLVYAVKFIYSYILAAKILRIIRNNSNGTRDRILKKRGKNFIKSRINSKPN